MNSFSHSLMKIVGGQIYHKWAVLTESDDPFSETKGYLLCDIYITGKDSAKIITDVSDSSSNIEK